MSGAGFGKGDRLTKGFHLVNWAAIYRLNIFGGLGLSLGKAHEHRCFSPLLEFRTRSLDRLQYSVARQLIRF